MKFKRILFAFFITFIISCFFISDRISNLLSFYKNNQDSNAKNSMVTSKAKDIDVFYKSSTTSSKKGKIIN